MHCDCLFALEIAELLLCRLLMMYGTGLWENVRWEPKDPIEELKSQTNRLHLFLSLNNGREADRVSLGTNKPLIKTK